jgi:putative endonuclease
MRSRAGEVDLIAERGALLVFVEVKTRRSVGTGMPAEAVTALKRKRIAAVALAYLARRRWTERPCRFDVVEVSVSGERVSSVRHIEDAFRLWQTP